MPFSREGTLLHHRTAPCYQASVPCCMHPLLLCTPTADAEDHPVGVPLDLAASSTGDCGGEEEWRLLGSGGDRCITSPMPKGTSPCCSDTLELVLHKERGQA